MTKNMTEEEFKKYVETHKWQFAHTMRFMPHFYTKRIWAEDPKDFDAFVKFVIENASPEPFGKGKVMYDYYRMDGWKYWRGPSEDGVMILINRAKIKDDNEQILPTGNNGGQSKRGTKPIKFGQ